MELSAVFNTAKPNQADLQTGDFSDHCYADHIQLYITFLILSLLQKESLLAFQHTKPNIYLSSHGQAPASCLGIGLQLLNMYKCLA